MEQKTPDLSILIPTMHKRAHFLKRLMRVLSPQCNAHPGRVELLTSTDNGEAPIGVKRNTLMAEAKGRYLAFVDDDDLVSTDYVSKILTAIQSTHDVCGIEGVMTWDGTNPERFVCSMRNGPVWRKENGVYLRPPNHLCPVKRELALKSTFPPLDFAEDKAYTDGLFPHLRTQEMIFGAVYFYQYRRRKAA